MTVSLTLGEDRACTWCPPPGPKGHFQCPMLSAGLLQWELHKLCHHIGDSRWGICHNVLITQFLSLTSQPVVTILVSSFALLFLEIRVKSKGLEMLL